MNNEQFETLMKNSIVNFGDSFVDMSEISQEPHAFSDRFYRDIGKLMKRKKRVRFPLFRTGFQRIIAVTVILIAMTFTMVMSVGAWRRAFFSFVTRPFDTHTEVEISDKRASPELIEENYELGYIPAGFALVESSDLKEICNTRLYSDGTRSLEFTQWVRSAYEPSVNTEGYDMERLSVNGCEGFGIEMSRTGRFLLSWDSGEYIFQIVGTIDRETALEMARSVVKNQL